MKPIVLIAAMDAGRAIGHGNDIPWTGERKFFKEMTMGNALIMGRMTYCSLPKSLAGRHSIILSRSFIAQTDEVASTSSMQEALSWATQKPGTEIYIGGGQQIYELFLPLATRIHLTVLDAKFKDDRFFPHIPKNDFSISASQRVEGPFPYTRFTYLRHSCTVDTTAQ